MLRLLIATAALIFLSTAADAGHRHHRHSAHHHVHRSHHAHHHVRRHHVARVAAPTTLLSHPEGCPARAFCGCGAAVRVFGTPVRALWLAAEWLRRFPRAEPAPGMVAARRHHVFVLEQHLGGNVWLAFDANSGRHQTRLHPRSIAGFTIVNPRGA